MRILLVEDDVSLAGTLERLLRIEGHGVETVRSAADAIAAVSAADYSVVILDRLLPDRDGIEVCRALRAGGCAVPLLMLTVGDAMSDRVEGLDAGADDCLSRPFEFEELHARLRALARRQPGLQPTVIEVGDLEVDTRAQIARRAGRPLELTRKEYLVLEILARHAGAVVSRAEITRYVWDESHDPVSNALEVTVNRLRTKVDATGEPLVHTRRGAGYYLATS